ncbi:MAG: YggS family pyridoxal phosphate enzyme [Omnitrophica WOR_2 bacterium GWA2_47_8]|nr:MAG: YggS family pyridoxal phosphate enzyme [Omnitrophica WOR_2 bacterium GWA2_47_8]
MGTTPYNIKKNIIEIRKAIPSSVCILAAAKKRTSEEIGAAIGAGVRFLGENYVQEAEEKYGKLKGQGTLKGELHLIGHLQKNKVGKALKVFDCIQTVDSLELAQEISRRAQKPFPILIQVNIGREPQKSGCAPEDTPSLVKKISHLPNILVKGLMAMAPHVENPEDARVYFREMKGLFDGICDGKTTGTNNETKEKTTKNGQTHEPANVKMDILSMGMSHDYKVAVEEGATMIRLGESIFGKRR